MKEELLNTRLRLPPCRPGIVDRPRLKAQFEAGIKNRLLLISAPAGFGKTSLLSQCLTEYSHPTIWISLDKSDNDPASFLRYLISGLQLVLPEIGKTADALLNSSGIASSEIGPLLTTLINELDSVPKQVVIILDDYHLIENQTVHDAVVFLIENASNRTHIIISTRSDPPLPLARWRARGQMREIRGDDLRFSPPETRQFFDNFSGDLLSADDIILLAEKTEGWVAGLQMAALSIQGRKDLSDFIRNFSGSHRYILDYLVEEVLHRQTGDIQNFLIRTSILERLNGNLCDAVTGQTGSRQKLDYLEKANMFIQSLDDDRRWYRYHHLFADLLQARLKESQPDKIETLHLLASRWYRDNNLINEAINHALAARDFESTAAMVEESALQLITQGQLNTLSKWTQQIPPESLNSRPRLCVDMAWLLVFKGKIQDVEPLLLKAENTLLQSGLTPESQDIRGSIAALRAFAADMLGNTDNAIKQAKIAGELLTGQNYLMRSTIPFVIARAHRLKGDLEKATEYLENLAGLAVESGNVMMLSAANYDLASTLKIKGKLHQAMEVYQDTLQYASDRGARDFGNIAKIDSGMSDLLREWNDIGPAHQLSLDAVERMKPWNIPTDLCIAYIMLSRVQQSMGESGKASETLEKASQLKHQYPLFMPVGAQVETELIRLWLASGNLAAAGRWAEESHPGEIGPLLVKEIEKIALARIRLGQGKSGQALEILTGLAESAESGGRQGKLIEILVLQSLAYKAQNKEVLALASLTKALLLAEPEGYIRTFIDEGIPVSEMLFTLRQRMLKDSGYQSISKDYLSRLLNSFPELSIKEKTGLVEDLTERELEILRLMAGGMTNKQIAAELYITPGTVKAHTASIFRKLDVENRTRAISLARDLNLL